MSALWLTTDARRFVSRRHAAVLSSASNTTRFDIMPGHQQPRAHANLLALSPAPSDAYQVASTFHSYLEPKHIARHLLGNQLASITRLWNHVDDS